jgi:hypothetical protein
MLEPQFQNVTPFTLRDRGQFLPDPPPSLPSEHYARDHNEVKLIGQDISPARTADQTHIAHFWGEPSPSGWSRIGNLVSARYGYDLHDTARLQALLNMAMADGFVVGWYQKRHFAFWRPVTAIRNADTDGNPSTQPDPSWLSLRPTPPLPTTPRRTACSAPRPRRSYAGSQAATPSRSAWSRQPRHPRRPSAAGTPSHRPNWKTPNPAYWLASTSASPSKPASRSVARSANSRHNTRCGRCNQTPPRRPTPPRRGRGWAVANKPANSRLDERTWTDLVDRYLLAYGLTCETPRWTPFAALVMKARHPDSLPSATPDRTERVAAQAPKPVGAGQPGLLGHLGTSV